MPAIDWNSPIGTLGWRDVELEARRAERNGRAARWFLAKCQFSCETRPWESAATRMARRLSLAHALYALEVEADGVDPAGPTAMSRADVDTILLDGPQVRVRRPRAGPHQAPTDGRVEAFESYLDEVVEALRSGLDPDVPVQPWGRSAGSAPVA